MTLPALWSAFLRYSLYHSCIVADQSAGNVMHNKQTTIRPFSSSSPHADHVSQLHKHMRQRGYPQKLLNDLEARIPYLKREAAMRGNTKKEECTLKSLDCICGCHPVFPPRTIREAMKGKHDWPFQSSVAFRRNKTLVNHLVRSKITLKTH